MFTINTKDGKSYSEGQKFFDKENKERPFTWDDVPQDVKIVSLQLTYPFPVRFRKPDGSSSEEVSPKLTIGNFDRYFFFNEATMPLLVQGQKVIREGVATLEAKSIAGIDDRSKIVLEIRMDRWGNCTVKKYPLKQLERSIKEGLFRSEIIRKGA